MRILVSNDDGYRAPGLACLVDALRPLADVDVVVPDRNRSGASNSLTLDNPIRATEMENGFVRVNGTPTDCVHLAITGLLDDEPDMVVAGINAGANLGDDVLYSGTVAAAVEGRFLGLPALAVSLVGPDLVHYETAARVVCRLLEGLRAEPLAGDIILNVNVPDLPYDEIAGLQVTRLGHRHRAEPVVKARDPRGQRIYWIGESGAELDAGPGTDFHAINTGHVSLTPMHVDLTHYKAMETTQRWIETVRL